MTDNPSSSAPSKGQTRGEETVAAWEQHFRAVRFRAGKSEIFLGLGGITKRAKLVSLIDSALASQEARHQQEMIAKDAEWIDRARRYFDIGSEAQIAKDLR